ncbi:dimethyladenosine transferase [Mycoplasmopsis californica HAZ160_1]|nr:dimethyladenosine transferase [Mycoplasmopsis californica HAZ160_1]BBG40779.1 dimethyladenosine transferase [Mycoplasmopsis californica]BBG41373.1 dimethyladenosine transferase [Mycoplasmopsis californica]BBG41966.1 dimethyladenosine transferase [Mycoplasmopsis californica]BBG42552.1 dimethyladenosine transferase [Mycoplasmopsis californica]
MKNLLNRYIKTQRNSLILMQKNSDPKAKKKYGQNFINDPKLISQIIEIANVSGKKIIEIGPGKGALSYHLANSASNYIAFEIDPEMREYLIKNNILKPDQVKLQDFLNTDLSQYNDYEIVGNIPYYITSEILLKIFDAHKNFKKITLMVQKEVADRLCAQPNSPDYSKLTLTAQYLANINLDLKVGREKFDPIPNVDSAIITLEMNKSEEQTQQYKELKDFFKLCFLARRKKLSWALKTQYSQEKILNAYAKLNLNEMVRIQQLSLEQVVDIFNELSK